MKEKTWHKTEQGKAFKTFNDMKSKITRKEMVESNLVLMKHIRELYTHQISLINQNIKQLFLFLVVAMVSLFALGIAILK